MPDDTCIYCQGTGHFEKGEPCPRCEPEARDEWLEKAEDDADARI